MVKIVENYTLTDYLGKGQYGKVFKAFHIDTKIEVAVKMIDLDKFVQIGKLAELAKNQIETLRLLEDNLNVVKFVEMIKTNHFIYLVYQYCEGGTLEELLRSKTRFTEKEALIIFKQLINAIRQLHQHHILHRDIKPNNIFFKSNHLKLADFGFCKRLRGVDDFTQTSLGSPLYMAPEILNGDVYGSKVDVWSCGIVLYEMLFGYCPYGHCNIKEMLQIYNTEKTAVFIPSEKFPISPITEMMLKRMLQKDQFRRISWEDFFYQYQITSNGSVLKKEKDFQYDLMKLMKRNTSIQKKKETVFKFDWARITQKNSSVHSQQLGAHAANDEGQLNNLLMLKRRIKQFEGQHAKMLQLTLVLQSILDCTKQFQYSNTIMYFLVHNLSNLVSQNLSRIQQYVNSEQELLSINPDQAYAMNKLKIVFTNETKSVTAKSNSIKVTLMQCQSLSKDVFKFPNKQILRKYLGEYIQKYEKSSRGSTDLSHEGSREQTLFLLKVVWGCVVAFSNQTDLDEKERQKWKQLREISSVKPETTKFQLSILLNRMLVFLGI